MIMILLLDSQLKKDISPHSDTDEQIHFIRAIRAIHG